MFLPSLVVTNGVASIVGSWLVDLTMFHFNDQSFLFNAYVRKCECFTHLVALSNSIQVAV